jgi:tetratricopeptide (TPR) repeat protein
LFVVPLVANGVSVDVKATTSGGAIVVGSVDATKFITNNNTYGLTPGQSKAFVAASTRQWRDLTAAQQHQLAELVRQLGVSESALKAFFAILGEREVAPEQLTVKLVEIAQRFVALKQQLAESGADSPQIVELKARAQQALDAGRLDEADSLLDEISRAQDTSLKDRLADRAATETSRGQLAMTQLRYRDAARHYAQAAHFAPNELDSEVARCAEADAYFADGNEFSDVDALPTAISIYSTLLGEKQISIRSCGQNDF